jgi:1-phosphofructokinase family hexose kinase
MPDATIICVSANPAMDRRLRMRSLTIGEINRADSARGSAGGKAAHVAMAARALGARVAWIGFLGGAIGQECARQLQGLDIEVISIPVAASTRVNLEIIDAEGTVTEILEPGGATTAEERNDFVQKCEQRVRNASSGAVLVISGSPPSGGGADFYTSLIDTARTAGARVFVDSSGDGLRASAKASPEFLKINRAEAEGLLGRPLKDGHEAVHGAMEIIENGAGSAAITLGADGLVWVESKHGPVWSARPPRLKAISAVGSGDSTLGGFACAAARGIIGEDALRLAVACGAANCLADAPARIDRATVESLIPQIEVQEHTI